MGSMARRRCDLRRLRHVRDLICTRKDVPAAKIKLALFGGAGFTADLMRAAERDNDIQLIDPDRLYFGD